MGEYSVTIETKCNDVTVQWVYESSGTDDVIMGVEAHDVIMYGPFDEDPSEELKSSKWKVLEVRTFINKNLNSFNKTDFFAEQAVKLNNF